MMSRISLKNISISAQIFLGFIIIIASAIISISISYYNSKKIIKSGGWVIHTHEVIAQLENIEARLLDLETGQRGYLITGRESYLEPFNKSRAVIYTELKFLRDKTSDNLSQTRRIDSLKKTIDKKIDELNQTIDLRRNVGFEAAKEIVDKDHGKMFMDIIRGQIGDIRNEELTLLAIRSPKPEQTRKATNVLLVGLMIFTMLIAIAVFLFIVRSITTPIFALKNGAEMIGKGDLDYKFGLQTSNEIGQLAKSFELMLVKLKETLASKEALEREVELRKEVENKLINSKQRIQEKNKELQQFSHITSHDLQEPLNSIISFSNLLEDEKPRISEVGQKSIEVIAESSQRMKEFITALLEYSRIGREKKLVEVDIELLIINLKTDLHNLIERKQATVIYKGSPLKIMAYKHDFIKLFQNLVENGIKYTDAKTLPLITIYGEEQSNHYLFSVSDNGIGIAEQHFDKVFQVFQRLHMRDQYSGTGIGLSNCQKIVELHHGKIWLESKIGKGTSFYFTVAKQLAS